MVSPCRGNYPQIFSKQGRSHRLEKFANFQCLTGLDRSEGCLGVIVVLCLHSPARAMNITMETGRETERQKQSPLPLLSPVTASPRTTANKNKKYLITKVFSLGLY